MASTVKFSIYLYMCMYVCAYICMYTLNGGKSLAISNGCLPNVCLHTYVRSLAVQVPNCMANLLTVCVCVCVRACADCVGVCMCMC